jgi:3-methyladenine DNA glycosylase AlkD
MWTEREFFVRKALGWVLRDMGRRHPDLVVAFVLPRAATASGVTIREAVKYLPPADRAAIEAARA